MTADELTELLRQHAGLIRKIAYAYCRDAAEDVVQEISIQLWRARDRYDPRFAHTTWIYRIALNVAISYFRRTERHRDTAPLEAAAAIATPPISDDLRQLLAWIDELGALDRALVLLYLDGNGHASIAAVLGISVSNVGTKLNRITDKLREKRTDGAR
jgi:RNA polymerase sigma factor (sigma-70 family)